MSKEALARQQTFWRVVWALVRSEVWARSKVYPASLRAFPPLVASCTPCSERWASNLRKKERMTWDDDNESL